MQSNRLNYNFCKWFGYYNRGSCLDDRYEGRGRGEVLNVLVQTVDYKTDDEMKFKNERVGSLWKLKIFVKWLLCVIMSNKLNRFCPSYRQPIIYLRIRKLDLYILDFLINFIPHYKWKNIKKEKKRKRSR